MKVLLDECVPWPLHQLLTGHECTTAQKQGWSALKNGDLLRRAEEIFDLFITSDQNMRCQQNLTERNIAVLELSTNDWRRIRAAATDLRAAVESATIGEFRHLDVP